MLAAHDAIPFLLKREFLSPAELLAEPFEVVSAHRRNQNLHVRTAGGEGYFLKQGNNDVEVGSVKNEARIYRLLQAAELNRVRSYAPTFHGYEQDVLILGSVPQSEDLQQYIDRRGGAAKQLAEQIGRVLGCLHRSGESLARAADATGDLRASLPVMRPTVLMLHQPPLQLMQSVSGVGLQMIKLVQKYDLFGQRFDQLVADWRTDSMIHGDIKLGNFLVARRAGGKNSLKLVDWEFAGWGDPSWDVGSVFGCFLTLWLKSIPIARADQPDEFLHLATFPLEKLQPVMQTFWQAYVRSRGFTATEAEQELERALLCTATSLVQTAYEHAKVEAFLTPVIISLIQLSMNIFGQPQSSARDLLGLTA